MAPADLRMPARDSAVVGYCDVPLDPADDKRVGADPQDFAGIVAVIEHVQQGHRWPQARAVGRGILLGAAAVVEAEMLTGSLRCRHATDLGANLFDRLQHRRLPACRALASTASPGFIKTTFLDWKLRPAVRQPAWRFKSHLRKASDDVT